MATNDPNEQGGHAGTSRDSDAQKHLRNVIAEEIEHLMHKHQVGGIVLLSSRDATAWRIVLPTWIGLKREGAAGWRFKWKKEEQEVATLTAHFVLSLRDAAVVVTKFLGHLAENLEKHVDITHERIEHFDRVKEPESGDKPS